MPTALPRHMITETPVIARAIDRAAERWPGEGRAELLRRIVEAYDKAVEDAAARERAELRAKRLAAIERTSGKYLGLWPANWRELRDAEWPE